MKDILDELAAAHRELRMGSVPAGEAHAVVLRRRYAAEINDVWDAITSAERLSRWFLPVSGDLRLGGRYQLQGNAGGEILRCEPPRLLKVSWLFGPDAKAGTSEVEVRLTPGPSGDTEFELVHTAVVDEAFFSTYGPGATGVGWDLGLLGLALHLAGGEIKNPGEFEVSPEAREFSRRSAASWGEAHLAAGGDPAQVAAAVEATTTFYAPDPT
ncbi:Activator of Hsp90 ATPase homolog 1-like protein [Micromonospora pallida]|uniref:Activator of Hsp90 ATPase homolog 1-like protein n=1 Tax=Micromonospora pallida TaxID=145854 RepID=A0A1C6SPB5_9ACTN|nr:SRPBCC domain-containing protein [Micromonospora pallida]SCL31371.1 Activator of Hsp90 ATPase homolog 1-like protein [Micromonospora pallida]